MLLFHTGIMLCIKGIVVPFTLTAISQVILQTKESLLTEYIDKDEVPFGRQGYLPKTTDKQQQKKQWTVYLDHKLSEISDRRNTEVRNTVLDTLINVVLNALVCEVHDVHNILTHSMILVPSRQYAKRDNAMIPIYNYT